MVLFQHEEREAVHCKASYLPFQEDLLTFSEGGCVHTFVVADQARIGSLAAKKSNTINKSFPYAIQTLKLRDLLYSPSNTPSSIPTTKYSLRQVSPTPTPTSTNN